MTNMQALTISVVVVRVVRIGVLKIPGISATAARAAASQVNTATAGRNIISHSPFPCYARFSLYSPCRHVFVPFKRGFFADLLFPRSIPLRHTQQHAS